jgi:hypothetical protein
MPASHDGAGDFLPLCVLRADVFSVHAFFRAILVGAPAQRKLIAENAPAEYNMHS